MIFFRKRKIFLGFIQMGENRTKQRKIQKINRLIQLCSFFVLKKTCWIQKLLNRIGYWRQFWPVCKLFVDCLIKGFCDSFWFDRIQFSVEKLFKNPICKSLFAHWQTASVWLANFSTLKSSVLFLEMKFGGGLQNGESNETETVFSFYIF